MTSQRPYCPGSNSDSTSHSTLLPRHFTIGLAAWLTVRGSATCGPGAGRPVMFEFWLKIFGVVFGPRRLRVVMAFQLGTNWSERSWMSGLIQGIFAAFSPTETFTAVFREAKLFRILLFGRPRVPRWFDSFSTGHGGVRNHALRVLDHG